MAFSQISPGLPFVGLEINPIFGFSAIVLAPDMLASKSKALKTQMIAQIKKNLSQKMACWVGAQGHVKLAKNTKTCPHCDITYKKKKKTY